MHEQSQRFDLTHTSTEVRARGEGPTVLMIQGLGTDQRAWEPVTAVMAGSVRCLTFDNRGVGTAGTAHHDLTFDALAEDVAELIEAIGEGPLHIAGVSMGGGIAMRVAARHPDLVRTVSLHSTTARPDARLLSVLDFREAVVASGQAATLLRPLVGLFAWGPAHQDVGMPTGVTEVGSIDIEQYRAHLNAARTQWMTDEELATITAPTLITVGDEDILTTPGMSRELAKAIPGSKLVIVGGGGHGYYLEESALLGALQMGWILQHEHAALVH
ncbi:alpha/beta hydrolase [Nocardioides carbamazepini]|uniref:alpha/beta fold hydrolase n=1 Tax=Nocardioides carbamazepini TaxID=2854259 RepID=UPI00214A6765|nr:alpha/beta hydrolase [Nocardioides carbamazepini]MCR1785052.1 alpha/beta hydrolase [Nocardioides carbamazepini]